MVEGEEFRHEAEIENRQRDYLKHKQSQEHKNKILSYASKGVVFIALAATIVIAFFYFPSGFRAIMIGIVVGAGVGLFSWSSKAKQERGSIVASLITFAIIGGLIGWVVSPSFIYADTLSATFSGAKNTVVSLFNRIAPFTNPATASKFFDLGTPSTSSKEETSFKVAFSSATGGFNAIVSASNLTDQIQVVAKKCSAGGVAFGIVPSQIFLTSANNEQRFHCQGSAQGDISLELQRPVSIKLPLSLNIAKKSVGGKISSLANAPYSLRIGSKEQSTFGIGDNNFYILLERQESKAELIEITSIKITTLYPDIEFKCPDFLSAGQSAEINNLDSNALRAYDKNPSSPGTQYAFECKATVNNAKDYPERISINSEVLYNVKNVYTSSTKSLQYIT